MAASVPAQAADKKPNILGMWGDDVGIANISAYSGGVMGYQTPNLSASRITPSSSIPATTART
jgi:arylsulfatase